MFPTTTISITFTDIVEQPELFKKVLQSLLDIADNEIKKQEAFVKPIVRRRKKPVEIKEEEETLSSANICTVQNKKEK